jgi:hypothetical protein
VEFPQLPQGITVQRRPRWVIPVFVGIPLVLGLTVASLFVSRGIKLNDEINERYPKDYRAGLAAKMTDVPLLLRDTLLNIESPVLPGRYDAWADKMKVVKAQLHARRSLAYIPQQIFFADNRRFDDIKVVFDPMILGEIVQHRFSYVEQMDIYLDRVYFGGDEHAIFGVHQASKVFFGKEVSKLTTAEIALLAGVIKDPEHYSPVKDPGASKQRRDVVLGVMKAEKLITNEQFEQAMSEAVRGPSGVRGLSEDD